MVGGDIMLARHGAQGELRWRSTFPTGSESTELTTLNALLIDDDGMVAGIGSTFNDNTQRAYLFRFDPVRRQLLYIRQAENASDPTDIVVTEEGKYLVTGARLDFSAPLFSRAYVQRFDRQTGEPIADELMLDVDGDEKLYDLTPHPEGGYFAAGQVVSDGGAGAVRASLSRLDAMGNSIFTLSGPVDKSENARLYGYDIELLDGTVYLLQWGDIGVLSGSLNTSPILTAFNVDGTALWTRRYELPEYPGEAGLDMVIHRGGLLIYGYALGGERDLFLLYVAADGGVRWGASYVFPGRALLYPRCNQQLYSNGNRITVAATYTYGQQRSHEGLLLQLDARGETLSDCVNRCTLRVSSTEINDRWEAVTLRSELLPARWATLPVTGSSVTVEEFSDCDIPCMACGERRFAIDTICRGDSVLLQGDWRTSAGIYLDTIDGLDNCDTLLTTELFVVDGPVVTYTQNRGCGLATSEIDVRVTGGIPPYTYDWSTTGIVGANPTLSAGTYLLTVTDAGGCRPATVEVVVSTTDRSLDYQVLAPNCPGDTNGSIRLLPAGAGMLKLLDDTSFVADEITGLAAGSYSIIIRTSSGCDAFRQITVPTAAPLSVSLTGPRQATLGQQLSYDAVVFPDSLDVTYAWLPPDLWTCTACSTNTTLALADTTLGVTVTDSRGCSAGDSLLLNVNYGVSGLYLPTAFSPNGDGTNDEWVPGFGPEVSAILSWQVFDRWGSLVWQYGAAHDAWWAGGDAGAGVYLYSIEFRLIDGKLIRQHGEVTLVR
jgi:gliding motility-associated-like protein